MPGREARLRLMKRRLMITIDVEAQPVRAESKHVDRLIYGKFGEEEFGIGKMMSIAEKHGVKLVTFLDYVEECLYGESLLDVGRDIMRRGHDLQLHMHPEFLPAEFFSDIGIRRLTHLDKAGSDLSCRFLDFVLQAHGKVSHTAPVAFRGGGYRFGPGILKSLKNAGILVNSSYNPTGKNQLVKIGAKKQFYWDNGILELPISCLDNFMGSGRLCPYNFNAAVLTPSDSRESAERHQPYLDQFYATFGEDAIAVMVMHSWSFLKIDGSGHYSTPDPLAVERFDRLLESLKETVAIVTATDIAGLPAESITVEVVPLNQSLPVDLRSPAETVQPSRKSIITHCPICRTPFSRFEDLQGKLRRCPTCGSRERQRVFADNYQSGRFTGLDLQGKRLLAIAPTASELRFLRTIAGLQVVTLDIRLETKPDIVADICRMPQVPDESFDVIYAGYVLSCVYDLNSCIGEFKRVLVPGGVLLCSDPVRPGQATEEHANLADITGRFGREAYDKYKVGNFRTFGGSDQQQIMSTCFAVQEIPMTDVPSGNAITWHACWKAMTGPVQLRVAELFAKGGREIIPYEDCLNVDSEKAVSQAEHLLKKGYGRRGYPLVMFDKPIPWQLNSQSERSWNFYLHCWDMLVTLLKAHSISGEHRLLKPVLPIVLDWMAKHADHSANDLSPFAWYDMAVGKRAYRLAYLIDAGDRAGLLDDPTRRQLWELLEQHQRYLADDANIVFHNNHGFYQVVGQLAMGRRFASASTVMAEAYAQGRSRLLVMLRTQFTEEGVHREHSPDYHRMVYETLKSMIGSGLVEDAETIAFADRIEDALAWFVLPGGHIANFGDSDYRSLATVDAREKWRRPHMRYVVSNGAVGEMPPDDHMAFPESGYFVVRRPSAENPGDFAGCSYLAQQAAFHSRTHKHADDLCFIWSDRGSDILVDAGRYGYLGKTATGSDLWLDGFWYSDPNRIYCESTSAHNTLEFDNRNYRRHKAEPYGSALKRWFSADCGVVAVETECRQFDSIIHARVLVFLPGRWLLVFDWYHDDKFLLHDVKQWFHLAPGLSLQQDGGGQLVSLRSSPQPLRVVSLLSGAAASKPYLGQVNPVMQGWWSARERHIEPAHAFCFELNQTDSASLATLFSFSDCLTADTGWSQADGAGREAQFRWTDESGRHELYLQRPAEGDLTVDYSTE
jgi:SAM-dependent methyltransferase